MYVLSNHAPGCAPAAAGHQLNTTEWNDGALYQQTQLLKTRNPNLKTLIAVGGWAHNDPNATTLHLFSKAVATASARRKFIANILAFTAKYGFDGWVEAVGRARAARSLEPRSLPGNREPFVTRPGNSPAAAP